MTERGKGHLGALCVVAANLAERTRAVLHRGMPYVIDQTVWGVELNAANFRRR